MSKTVLILIRHGETTMNVKNIFRGRMDVSLTENGLEQARQLADALKTFPVAAVYSSPLRRAMETARFIAGPHNVHPESVEEFNNICLGEWEGLSKEEVKISQPDLWRQWVSCPEEIAIPGAETLDRIRNRVGRGLSIIIERHVGKVVAVVTHRSVLKVTLAEILGLKKNFFWKFYLDNCSYSLVEHHPMLGYTLTRMNEICHLENPTTETF